MNPQDSPELRLLRPKVLTAAGFLGHTGVMQQAAVLLKQAAAGQKVLTADVAKAVYSLAVGSGDEQDYATVQKLYEQVRSVAQSKRVLLPCALDGMLVCGCTESLLCCGAQVPWACVCVCFV